MDSKGGISNFASELDVSLIDAVRIGKEVEGCLRSVLVTTGGDVNVNATTVTAAAATTYDNNGHLRTIQNHYNKNKNDNNNNNNHHHGQYRRMHREPPQTAASLIESNMDNATLLSRRIISFVRSIDKLLGGGFRTKEVIEISGLPGVGTWFWEVWTTNVNSMLMKWHRIQI